MYSSLEGCAAVAEQAAKLDGIAKATLADAAAHYADHAAENLAALIASKLIGVNVRTPQNWEQHRTRPTGPARALLKIVASDPKSAIEALHA